MALTSDHVEGLMLIFFPTVRICSERKAEDGTSKSPSMRGVFERAGVPRVAGVPNPLGGAAAAGPSGDAGTIFDARPGILMRFAML